MKRWLVVSIAGTAAWFYSCGLCSIKTIDCTGYNDTLLDRWFPYTDFQQLVYTDSLQETDTFTISTTISEPYQTHTGYMSRPNCEMSKTMVSKERDSLNLPDLSIMLGAHMHLNDYVETRNVALTIKRAYFNIYNITASAAPLVNGDYNILPVEYMDNVRFFNRTYARVYKAQIDTGANKKYTGIYQIYFSKGQGLVAYSEYPGLKTWVKQ